MGAALHHRLSDLHGARLPGWITLSVLAHLLVLSAGGGNPPGNPPHRRPLMTVDISYITPENPAPLIVPGPEPDIEARHTAPDPPPPAAGRKAASTQSPPEAAAEQRFPFNTYFGASELEVRAEPSNEVLLYYPMVAYRRRLAGVVQFNLFINAQGGLDKVELIEATPPGHFEEAAWDAVKQLRFTPALKNGRPVKSRKTIDVVFDPLEDFSKPVAKQPDSSVAEK